MIPEKNENGTADDQTLDHPDDQSEKGIDIGQVHPLHELYEYVSDDDEKYDDEYEGREEGKDKSQIVVLNKITECLAQGPVEDKCGDEPDT
jgi:hypothetical protein